MQSGKLQSFFVRHVLALLMLAAACVAPFAARAQSPTAFVTRSMPSEADLRRFSGIVETASRAYGVDGALVHAVIFAESSYNPLAVSPQGATGLMQLMPETARRYGVRDAFDPVQNIHAGVRLLRDLLALFNGDVELAIAAYNAGANAVIRAGNRIPPHLETTAYVPKVIGYYRSFQARAG